MNEEQINEAMRLGELWATYAWKACSHGADETVKSQAGRAALEAYLSTIGEPENTFPLNPNGASKWAHLQKHDGAQAIGVVFRTGSGSVGSLVDGRVVWADWLAHPNGSKPESVNAELLEALKDARHCIGIDRDTLVDCHTNPCTGYLDPDGALAKAEYDDVIDAADAAIARAESAIETPAKVSPCAGHAAQQEADDLVSLRGCNSRHGGVQRAEEPCIYRMRTTDPGCTGCVWRGEDQPAEAGHEND